MKYSYIHRFCYLIKNYSIKTEIQKVMRVYNKACLLKSFKDCVRVCVCVCVCVCARTHERIVG